MIKAYPTLILYSLIASLPCAYAATANSDSAGMMFDNKPIDSLCFNPNENNPQTVDLQHCGAKADKYLVKGKNDILGKKGFIGYDWQDPSFPSSPQGYSYYKYFNAPDNHYWVYTINSGGGSGEFTTVELVERKDSNTLKINSIAGGDRCNGGIQDVSEKNQSLVFSVNLTPYDVIALADKKYPKIKAYDDLATCAACCAGKAFYTINSKELTPQLNHVDFGNMGKASEMPTQGNYSECFNKLLVTAVKEDKGGFSQDKINVFAERFYTTCVKQ